MPRCTEVQKTWKKWDEAEEAQLEFCWGVYSLETIAKRLDRTAESIRNKARELQLGSPRRGTTPVSRLARETGYAYTRIRAAMRHLGIPLRRAHVGLPASKRGRPSRRVTALTFDERKQLLEFLASYPDGKRIGAPEGRYGDWGVELVPGKPVPAACVSCSQARYPHVAKGVCRGCYNRRMHNQRKAREILGRWRL